MDPEAFTEAANALKFALDVAQPHLLACLYNKVNTLQSVADCLNSKGLRTAPGSEFTPTAVRRLMLAFNVSF
ncbi:hypothetical protein [Pseudomonas sp. IT-P253]|jgi:hypothetical protein|uniref:hypothetical protein n=1 Tax=Pseudomonas sp. IT-P253 TaxID=3026455 RepID=UPI0039E01DA4